MTMKDCKTPYRCSIFAIIDDDRDVLEMSKMEHYVVKLETNISVKNKVTKQFFIKIVDF